ncbi:MAG: DUF2399 domain-containing protein [Bacilli bacterium]|nr:DUF2399 domain-containing protein [Bacilli bacterium]
MNTKLYNYFNNDGYKSFIKLLKDKYVTYGYCTGTITITPKSDLEVNSLSLFLGLNVKLNVKLKIKVSYIQAKLDDSIFDGTKVDDLVKLFYPNIKTNKELREENNNFIQIKYGEYRLLYNNTNIDKLFEHEEAIKKIKYLIKNDDKLLNHILKSLNNLPIFSDDVTTISIFSSNIIGNPHFYDLDTHNSNIFLQFICFLYNLEYLNNRKFKIDTLMNVGLVIDDVSNYVITYNLSGNRMLDSFRDNNMPLNLNLYNINNMDNIRTSNNKLLVVENPSFISVIEGKKIDYSVIVTSGNSNLVVYKLMDKLDTDIYFNGDFDPEGLMIADKFKREYPTTKFIGYNRNYYYNGISNNMLNDSRLKKLDNIICEDLLCIKELLLQEKYASYQESNYDLLIKDLHYYND